MGFWGAIESLKNEGWKENKGKEQKLEYYQNEARIVNDRELVQMCTRSPVNSTRRHTTRKTNGGPMDIEAS